MTPSARPKPGSGGSFRRPGSSGIAKGGHARRVAIILTGLFVAGAVWQVVGPVHADFFGIDHRLYMRGADRFLATGSPYAPWQLQGPYVPEGEIFLYPPTALLLMLPFRLLPDILWWLAPVGILATLLWRWQPSPWAWPVLGFVAFWPRTVGAVVAGNTDMWIAAFAALGLEYGWPMALVLFKPSAAPLILAGLRRPRQVAIGIVGFSLASILFLPLWLQYAVAVANAGDGVSLAYSLPAAPLLVSPLIAYVARRDRRSGASTATSAGATPA